MNMERHAVLYGPPPADYDEREKDRQPCVYGPPPVQPWHEPAEIEYKFRKSISSKYWLWGLAFVAGLVVIFLLLMWIL